MQGWPGRFSCGPQIASHRILALLGAGSRQSWPGGRAPDQYAGRPGPCPVAAVDMTQWHALCSAEGLARLSRQLAAASVVDSTICAGCCVSGCTGTSKSRISPPAPERSMTPPPQVLHGSDADAFAEQMQRAADKGDAETLDALGEQLRDVLDDDLRGTLTDMHERLRAALDQPPAPAAARRSCAAATPSHRALTATTARFKKLSRAIYSGVGRFYLPPPTSHPAQPCVLPLPPILSPLGAARRLADVHQTRSAPAREAAQATPDSSPPPWPPWRLRARPQHQPDLQGDAADWVDYAFPFQAAFPFPRSTTAAAPSSSTNWAMRIAVARSAAGVVPDCKGVPQRTVTLPKRAFALPKCLGLGGFDPRPAREGLPRTVVAGG